MNARNTVNETGRLANDPMELKRNDGEIYGYRFTLAVERNYKNKSTGKYDADFIPVQVTSPGLRQFVSRLVKGTAVNVVGSIQTRRYKTAEGEDRSTWAVSADSISYSVGNSKNAQAQAQAQAEEPVKEPEQEAIPELPFD